MTAGGTLPAFVPGHVTVFFSPHRRDDPARTGSTGAGLTLSHGVTVRAEPADDTEIVLDGEAVGMEPVERVLSSLSTEARVVAESPLPLGAGFGVSGAMSLGTALSANHALECARSENELVTMAHRAEVGADTGLGDVVAQARGGVPIRLSPGAPGYGEMDGIPASVDVEYLSFGGLSTDEIITGDVEELSSAGERALSALRERPTLSQLFERGRDFAREADLLTPRVETAIEDVLETGGEATMAMLGETVVALGSGLTEAGYDPASCRISPAGARLRTG